MKQNIFLAGVLLVVLGVMGAVGNADYADEVRQQEHYCDMVADGHWPAYDDSINCEEE